MNARTRITLRLFCEYARVDFDLAREFAEYGLYPAVFSEDDIEIETRHLYEFRKIVDLHRTLGINKEGIEVILGLRKQICDLQEEVEHLRNEIEELNLHEGIEEPETLKRLGLLIEVEDPFTIPGDS